MSEVEATWDNHHDDVTTTSQLIGDKVYELSGGGLEIRTYDWDLPVEKMRIDQKFIPTSRLKDFKKQPDRFDELVQ
jgi:hypothetical protein